MARDVAVTATLKADQLIREGEKVAAVMHEVHAEVEALDDKMNAAEHEAEQLAGAMAVAEKEVGGLGEKSAKASAELTVLDRRIAAVKRSVMALGIEFAATGDKAAGARLGKQQSLLTDLEKLRNALTGLEKDGKSAEVAIADLGKAASLQNAARKTGAGVISAPAMPGAAPFVIGGLVALLAAAAPAIGAMVSGAVVGAVGTGGIVGGVLAASHSPQVKTAFAGLADDAKFEFFNAGKSFIEPTLRSIADLDKALKAIDLSKTFALAAPDLEIIVNGLAALVKNIMPGLNKLLERSGPFATAAAKGLAYLGTSLSEFLANVSLSRGAVEGLTFLFNVLGGAIKFLGINLFLLSQLFHGLNTANATFVGGLNEALGAIGIHNDRLHKLAVTLNEVAGQGVNVENVTRSFSGTVTQAQTITGQYSETLDEAAHHAQALADATNAAVKAEEDMIRMHLDLAQANIAVDQGFADLNEKLIKGRGNWNDSTQAGRDNQRMILDQIGVLDQQRQAAIANSDGTVAAINAINAKYDEQLEKLLKVAGQAGDTQAALNRLRGDYHINVIVTLQEQVQLNKANAIDKALASHGFAAGGETPANEVFKVGEHGAEFMFSDRAHFVATKQMMAQTWPGSGPAGGQIVVQNQITLLDPMTGQRTRAILISEATSRGVPGGTASAAYP